MVRSIGLVLAVMLGASGAGCAADCESLCKEAQERDCTTISGDCAANCAALQSVASRGGCETQREDYHGCVNDDDVCTATARCSAQESALTQCTTAFCLANSSDPQCQTLASAF